MSPLAHGTLTPAPGDSCFCKSTPPRPTRTRMEDEGKGREGSAEGEKGKAQGREGTAEEGLERRGRRQRGASKTVPEGQRNTRNSGDMELGAAIVKEVSCSLKA